MIYRDFAPQFGEHDRPMALDLRQFSARQLQMIRRLEAAGQFTKFALIALGAVVLARAVLGVALGI